MFALALAGALLVQTGSQSTTWQPVGLSGGGAMYTPAISPADPRLMMLNCDMSGTYLSHDAGRSWQMINCLQLRSNTQCRPAFHPTDPKVIYAANGWSGMAVSRDGGAHWSPTGSIQGTLTGDIVIDHGQPEDMIVGTESSVLYSSDSGRTWSNVVGPQGSYLSAHFDQTSPPDRRACFVATTAGIWCSHDGAKSWMAATDGIPAGGIKAFAAGSNRATGKVALYCSVPGKAEGGRYVGGIYRSLDRGRTWKSAMGAGLNLDTQAFDEWAMGPVAQYARLACCDVDPMSVFASNTNTGVPPPHDATIYCSHDGGASWKALFQADPRFPGCNVEPDYTTVVDGQFYQDVPDFAVADSDPSKIVMVNGGSLYATGDGGARWICGHTRQAAGAPGEGPQWTCTGLVVTTTWNYFIDPFEPNRHFICYTDLGFARSLDHGRTWEWWARNARAPWQNTCYQLAFDPKVPGRVWGAFSDIHDIPNGNIIWNHHNSKGPGGVCVSQDHGATWAVCGKGLPLAPTTSIVVDPASPVSARVLYAGQFGQGVFRSDDGGQTWAPKNQGLGSALNMRVNRLVLHRDGTLFAVVTALYRNGQFDPDGVGIYRSKDRGEHWTKVDFAPHFLWPKDLTADPDDSRVLYVGACDARQDQAGLWRTEDGGAHWTRLVKEGSEHFGAYLSPSHTGWIYATLTEGAPGAGLWLSKDRGQTWAPVNDFPFDNAMRVAFDPSDPSIVYVTTFGGSVWRGPADFK